MTYWEWVRRQLQHPVKKPKPRPVEEIFRRQREIDRIVDRLSENQQRVLWERYVERRSWQIIAIRLSYDERWVRSIEERAVDAIGRKLRGQ